MRKRERQQLIETLITRRRLSTQSELLDALSKHKCRVTQATVSRDIREMGVRKGSDRDGRSRYILPPPRERQDPEAVLARVLGESGVTAQPAQNLVVIRSEPGTAPNVGRAVDELGSGDIIGTVAGDDTVLLVLASVSRARKMAAYLEKLKETET